MPATTSGQNRRRDGCVPENVDGIRISAEFRDGMLFVTLPKTEAAAPKVTEGQIH